MINRDFDVTTVWSNGEVYRQLARHAQEVRRPDVTPLHDPEPMAEEEIDPADFL